MLFKVHELNAIKSGNITLAFRKWEKPAAKKGGTQKTHLGVIGFVDVVQVSVSAITDADAIKAGYDNRGSLLAALNKRGKGNIYRVKLKYVSADPRIKLRQQASLSDEDFQKLRKRLERLDSSAKTGPWTMAYLQLIKKYPQRRAGDLVAMIDMERLDFKLNVRKLKNLGLTISHEVGYSVSPLGTWVMKKAKQGLITTSGNDHDKSEQRS